MTQHQHMFTDCAAELIQSQERSLRRVSAECSEQQRAGEAARAEALQRQRELEQAQTQISLLTTQQRELAAANDRLRADKAALTKVTVRWPRAPCSARVSLCLQQLVQSERSFVRDRQAQAQVAASAQLQQQGDSALKSDVNLAAGIPAPASVKQSKPLSAGAAATPRTQLPQLEAASGQAARPAAASTPAAVPFGIGLAVASPTLTGEPLSKRSPGAGTGSGSGSGFVFGMDAALPPAARSPGKGVVPMDTGEAEALPQSNSGVESA